MQEKLLSVKDLSVEIEEKKILRGIDLEIGTGEAHVLMGPNGAGKSTFGNVLMGNPAYKVTSGKILFDGKDITGEGTEKRAKMGMFLSFQNPLEVPGISLEGFLLSAIQQRTGKRPRWTAFQKELKEAMEILDMSPEYAERDLNVGFSGGEKKKAEILQMLMLKPRFVILDETDSGLDIDAARTVSRGIEWFREKQKGSMLIITHSTRILEYIPADCTHVLADGKIAETGGPELADRITREGFGKFLGRGERE